VGAPAASFLQVSTLQSRTRSGFFSSLSRQSAHNIGSLSLKYSRSASEKAGLSFEHPRLLSIRVWLSNPSLLKNECAISMISKSTSGLAEPMASAPIWKNCLFRIGPM